MKHFPNFIIGGTSNAGTSFLYSCLRLHPEVFLPKEMRPEPHFFYYSQLFEKGLDFYSQSWFSEVKNQKAIGDRSSSYMFNLKCAERIYNAFPNIKLIFIVRKPVMRTWSNYNYTVYNGLEYLSFSEALLQEKQRNESAEGRWKEVLPFAYQGRSFYGEQIKEYLKYFPENQILIISAEKMRREPHHQLHRIFQFLEISSYHISSLPSDFSSPSVINPKIQCDCRSYFGEKFNLILEKIRSNIEITNHDIPNEEDKKYFQLLTTNLTNVKLAPSEANIHYLQSVFEKDTELFFKISKNCIDFDQSEWA